MKPYEKPGKKTNLFKRLGQKAVLIGALAPTLLYTDPPRRPFRYSRRVFPEDGWEKSWNRFEMEELKWVPKRNSLVGSCVRVCRAGQGSGCRGGDLLSPPRFFVLLPNVRYAHPRLRSPYQPVARRLGTEYGSALGARVRIDRSSRKVVLRHLRAP